MIEKLKKNLSSERFSVKSISALFIFSAIILVFALFGLPTRQSKTSFGAAAQVNNTYISMADFKKEASRMEKMYSSMFGGNMFEGQGQFIRQQALENLISMELLSQTAKKSGIFCSDAEVRDMITKDIPVFQDQGRFHREKYMSLLKANQIDPKEFEDQIRKEKVNQRARRLLEYVGIPLAAETKKQKELKEFKRNLLFVKLNKQSFLSASMKKKSLPESEVQSRLTQPEFLKKIESDYNSHKDLYSTPDEIRAQHILIKVDPSHPETDAAALTKINEIKKKAEKEDFSLLAKQYSEDAGSKPSGGDLGFFSHGKMVPEFEKAAFSQGVGLVGEPVKSSFGYHLIKVNEKKPAKESTLQEVQNTIAQKLIYEEKWESLINNFSDALKNNQYLEVEKLLAQIEMKWQETGWFDIGVESVPQLTSPNLTEKAFSLTKERPWVTHLVSEGLEDRYILRLKEEKREASPLPQDSVVGGQEATPSPSATAATATTASKAASTAATTASKAASTAATTASKKSPPIPDEERIQKERGNELLKQWLEQETKTARIEKNPDIFPKNRGN